MNSENQESEPKYSYFKEVKKEHVVDRLDSIIFMSNSLKKTITNSKKLDVQTKKKVYSLYLKMVKVFDEEILKELKRQKKDGKQFISDEAIDDLVKEILSSPTE